jgi:hypothetical protein
MGCSPPWRGVVRRDECLAISDYSKGTERVSAGVRVRARRGRGARTSSKVTVAWKGQHLPLDRPSSAGSSTSRACYPDVEVRTMATWMRMAMRLVAAAEAYDVLVKENKTGTILSTWPWPESRAGEAPRGHRDEHAVFRRRTTAPTSPAGDRLTPRRHLERGDAPPLLRYRLDEAVSMGARSHRAWSRVGGRNCSCGPLAAT